MHHRFQFPLLATLLAALFLAGCASEVPLLIRKGPLDSPAPTVVRTQLGDHIGKAVRWGGLVIATENREQVTRLTLLARPLSRDGEPDRGDTSLGRFIALVPGFLDPQVYAADRMVTVSGTVEGSEVGKVGEHDYVYPVVAAQAWYLWPRDVAYPYYDDPWYYYDPWWYGPGYYHPWYYPGYPYAWPYRYWR